MRLSHRPYSRGILILLVIAATGLWMTSPVGAQPGGWSPTGSMQVGRHSHTATLLPNGTVLVVGGHDVLNSTIVLNSAEIYDASTGTWSTTGSMQQERTLHTATLLSDGKVLVVGGTGGSGFLNSAEIYDPSTGT